MPNKTSQHVLSTSANLLGFCLVVLTSIHVLNKTESSYADEFTSIVCLLLILSTTFSFISIRTGNKLLSTKLEKLADYLFFLSLTGIFAIVLFLLVNFWGK
jgi:hypothetical protein